MQQIMARTTQLCKYFFLQVKWLEKFMSGMLCVGGGVLLATVFVHMIPEVRESLETARKLGMKPLKSLIRDIKPL